MGNKFYIVEADKYEDWAISFALNSLDMDSEDVATRFSEVIILFDEFLEEVCGIKFFSRVTEMQPNPFTRSSTVFYRFEVFDEKKYMWFLLRWS